MGIKICGYYLLIFLSIRYYKALKRVPKDLNEKYSKENMEVTNFDLLGGMMGISIIYIPGIVFIISQLYKLGLRF